jgi:hypothetical protein
MPFPFLARHMTARLEDYMRVVEQRRLAQMNRGASQDTIERYTFPHKYKQVNHIVCSRGVSGETDCIHKNLIIFQDHWVFEVGHSYFLINT